MSRTMTGKSTEINMTHGGLIDVSALPYGTSLFLVQCGRRLYHVEVRKNAADSCVSRWAYAAGSRYDDSAKCASATVGNSAVLRRAEIEQLEVFASAMEQLRSYQRSLGIRIRFV